jgi:hypothetical protein
MTGHIPSAHDPRALALYEGTTLLGRIVKHDGSVFLFGADGTLIGEYRTQREAMRALPSANSCEGHA